MTANTTTRLAYVRMRASIVWALLYSALWALLGQGRGWSFGLPLIIAAVLLSDRLQLYPLRVRLRRVLPFTLFFIHRLLCGAWDVSVRTLRRQPPHHAGWVTYQFHAATPTGVRLLMSSITGMLPGTLAARIDDDVLHMHIMDKSGDWQREAQRLERELVALIPHGGEP